MKFENLTFSCKSRRCGKRNRYTVPSVRFSLQKLKKRGDLIVISFPMCDSMYTSNNHVRYAIAGNRCYFMFCGESEVAYKMTKTGTSKTNRIGVMYNKELSRFVRDIVYTPKLDNECGLWYVEY